MFFFRCFSFVELFILVFYVHEHVTTSLHNENQTAKHTSQQQTIPTNHHPAYSHPMAVTANTPRGGDRPPPHEKNDRETTAKGGKGQKKRSASNDGNTADKSHKQSSAEGDNDKNEDTGTNGAPGDGERLRVTNGRDTSSAKGDGALTPHDRDAETNLQKDADTDACYNRNAETNEQKDAGTESQSIFETPVRNTTASKNGFFLIRKNTKI